MSITEIFYGAGGRKRSSSRVFLVPCKTGVGKFTVNKQDLASYFCEIAAVEKICQAINLLNIKDLLAQYNIKATVQGGGKTGQRDALALGLAKALVMLESKKPELSQKAGEETTETEEATPLEWRRRLRKAGMLTRDSRKVEPKRYGLHKARKRAPLVKR